MWGGAAKACLPLEDISGRFPLICLKLRQTGDFFFFFFYSAIKTVFRIKTGLFYFANAITFLSPPPFYFQQKKKYYFGHGILKE